MSCFVVNRANISCAVSLFEQYDQRHGKQGRDYSVVGRALWKMNADAFFARYEEKAKVGRFIYRKGDAAPYSPIQKIKATQCLQYNCSEGDVPKQEFFLELAKVLGDAESTFICNLPAYQAAMWDITA